jgi:hypothetical protein
MRNVAVVSHRELAESITNLVKAPDSQTQTQTSGILHKRRGVTWGFVYDTP